MDALELGSRLARLSPHVIPAAVLPLNLTSELMNRWVYERKKIYEDDDVAIIRESNDISTCTHFIYSKDKIGPGLAAVVFNLTDSEVIKFVRRALGRE